MIAASVAAVAMVASAKTFVSVDGGACGEDGEICYSAYKVTLSLKTTAPKSTVKKDSCDECETSCTWYRKQSSLKINGLIWGEADCDECDTELPENIALWTKDAPVAADLTLWIGQIDKTGKKAEAYGTLAGDDFGALSLAGFGAMSLKTTKATDCVDATCTGYVKSLSGNAAGYLVPAEVEDCDYVSIGCCEDATALENTAAYGTWKVSYNAATAKKMAKAALTDEDGDATKGYKFPAAAFEDGELVAGQVIIEE